MPRVSHRQLQKEQKEEIETYFSELIVSLTDRNDIQDFFTDFLTKEEKTMLAKRLMVFLLIKKGYAAAAIQTSLHVSYETVRSYTKQLDYKNPRFHKILATLLEGEKTKVLWEKIENILNPFSLMLEANHNMKSRAKLASGDFTND